MFKVKFGVQRGEVGSGKKIAKVVCIGTHKTVSYFMVCYTIYDRLDYDLPRL
jgi:hypothetical protein